MSPLAYLRIWLASARYSAVRAMTFRFDFFLWLTVDTLWMGVNLLFIEVMFNHVEGIAGWTKPQMLLLVGTAMLVMRLAFALVFTNLMALDRNFREGTLDFTLAQPGHPLFMIATRKVEFDSLTNSVFAACIVIYAVHANGLHPGIGDVLLYIYLLVCGLMIHFSIMTILVSLVFWMGRVQDVQGGYFGLFEVSKLPRPALHGAMEIAFVYALPAVIVTNVPASALLNENGPDPGSVLWVTVAAIGWFLVAVTIFRLGLRRYQSASS